MKDKEFDQLVEAFERAFATVNGRKTEQSISNAREQWNVCLKEAEGNFEKARKLYNGKNSTNKSR